MLRCVVNGKGVGAGIIDRTKSNKPPLTYLDIYVQSDGGTHRIWSVTSTLINNFKFGDDFILEVAVYPGDREYIKYIQEVK